MIDNHENCLDDETPYGALSMEELEHFHRSLSAEEREELLECLLIVAPQGGEAMIRMLRQELLHHALHELMQEHRDQVDKSGEGAV